MNPVKKLPAYLLFAIPLVFFYAFFLKYTVNVPVNDDYEAILGFINRYISAESISEKVAVMLAQHNEHRIVYDRLWTLIQYKITGKVNFTTIAFIGNLSLIPICYIFFREFKKIKKPLLLFFPITVLLFNITFWENMTYAMATLSNLTVYLFIMLSLFFISRQTLKTREIILAWLFFCFALFTQGGGIFVLPVSVCILLYKKEYKKLFLYVALCALPLALYFFNYQKAAGTGIVTLLFDFKVKYLLFVFAFLGNAFNYFLIHSNQANESVAITAIIGFVLFCVFIHITKTRYYKQNLFIYALMLLVVVSSLVTAFSRIGYGVETAGASRYRINGVIFLITILFWYIEMHDIKKLRQALIIGGSLVYLWAINIDHFEYLSYRKRELLTGMLFYKSGNPQHLTSETGLIPHFADLLKISKERNIYNPPSDKELSEYFPRGKKIVPKAVTPTDAYFFNSIATIDTLNSSYLIQGTGFLIDYSTRQQKIYVGLQNEETGNKTFYTAKQEPSFDLNPYFNKFNLQDGGFICRIKKEDVIPGNNKVSLMIAVDNEVKIAETDKILSK